MLKMLEIFAFMLYLTPRHRLMCHTDELEQEQEVPMMVIRRMCHMFPISRRHKAYTFSV